MSDPREKLAGWPIEDHLAFDIGFALPRGPVRGLRRALTDDERCEIAKAIVAHLRLCGWEFRLRTQPLATVPGRADRMQETITCPRCGLIAKRLVLDGGSSLQFDIKELEEFCAAQSRASEPFRCPHLIAAGMDDRRIARIH